VDRGAVRGHHARAYGRQAVDGRRDVAVVRTDDLFARAVAPLVGKTIHRIAFCSSSPHAILVLDGAGWHASKGDVAPDNVTLLTLPPYAPELNPVENVWQYLRSNKLAITVFDGYADIVDKCCNAWNFFANDKAAITSITTRQWAQVNL